MTVRALCEIEKSKSFGPKFATKHLPDLLAALLQICHAPISKPTSDSQVLLWQRLHEERQEFVIFLESILNRTYAPLLVQSLLLLQGPSPSHAKIIRVIFLGFFKIVLFYYKFLFSKSRMLHILPPGG